VVLQPICRVQCGENEFMTARDARGGHTVVAQVAYLAGKPSPGTSPLYRYRNPKSNACRDAHSLDPPWEREEYLGSTWGKSSDRVLLRQYADSGGHYVTLNANEPIPPAYRYVCDLGYGYERFGMDLTRLMSLKRGDVEVRFDRVAGGCIWHILHKQTQLVNNYFYGRQVCSALDIWTTLDQRRSEGADLGRYCACDCGLTAGWKTWFTDPSARMGSPCPVFTKQGDDTVLIRTIPVESNPETSKRLGGGPLNPVLYTDLAFEKRVTIGMLGRDGIIKFKVRCTSQSDWVGVKKSRMNICGVHLCQFMDRLYLYDPSTGMGEEEADWQTSPSNRQFRKSYSDKVPLPKGSLRDFTCVVLHDGRSHAVGLMGASPEMASARQGSVEYFLGYHWKQLGEGNDGAEFGNNTIMMTPMNGLPAGKGGGSYVIYLLVGSLDEVKTYARELYANRADLEW